MSVTPLPHPALDLEHDHDPALDRELEHDELVGAVIDGRYAVERVHGRGGMAVVYAGEHRELRRSVAIKVLDGMLAKDPEAVELFLHEARIASSLSHPHIVSVSDLGRLPDGRPYLVMPMIAGSDLASLLLREGPQPPRRVTDLLRGVASALDLIHAKGLVHRDIKSENLMHVASEDGAESVLVLDFGIASARAPRSRKEQGGWCGTPEFMPPEALAGEQPDQRGDVYSLATVAFELIAGCLPFDCENLGELIQRKTLNPARTLSEASGLEFDVTFEAVMARGLALAPDARYGSAGELIDDLAAAALIMPERIMPELPAARASAPPRFAHGRGRTLAGTGGAAGIAGALSNLQAAQSAQADAEREVQTPDSFVRALPVDAQPGEAGPESTPAPASEEPVSEITKLASEVANAARRAAAHAPANTNRKQAPTRPRPVSTATPGSSTITAAPPPAATPAPVAREAKPADVASANLRLSARDRIVASARRRTTRPPPRASNPASMLPPAPAPLGFGAALAGDSQTPGEHEHSSVFTRASSAMPPEPSKPVAATEGLQPITPSVVVAPSAFGIDSRLEEPVGIPDISVYPRDSAWNLPELDDSTRPPPAREIEREDDDELERSMRGLSRPRWMWYAAPAALLVLGLVSLRSAPKASPTPPPEALKAAPTSVAAEPPSVAAAIAQTQVAETAPAAAPAPVVAELTQRAAKPAEVAPAVKTSSRSSSRKSEKSARASRHDVAPAASREKSAAAAAHGNGGAPVLTISPAPESHSAAATEETRPARDFAHADRLTRAANDTMLRGDTETALNLFEQALEVDSGYAPAWRGKGLLLERTGRKRDAATAFRQFLKLQPNGIASDAIRERLDQLSSQ